MPQDTQQSGTPPQVIVEAERDVVNIGGEIAGGEVTVRAGRDVHIATGTRQISNTTEYSASSNTMADSTGRVAGEAVNIIAGRDLSAHGAVIEASGDTHLLAGRDIALGTVALDTAFGASRPSDGHSHTTQRTHLATQLASGGALTVVAGRDVTTAATQAKTGGDIQVAAGRDITVGAVKDTLQFDGATYSSTEPGKLSTRTTTHTEAVRGSHLQSQGDMQLAAGQRDLVVQTLDALGVTAYVASGPSDSLGQLTVAGSTLRTTGDGQAGHIDLSATGDVTLQTEAEHHSQDRWRSSTHEGMLSSTTIEESQRSHDTIARGSTLSGNELTVDAGRDVRVTGANAVADGDVTVTAGRNLTLDAAQNTHTSTSYRDEQTSGVFGGGGGLSFTIGTQRTEQQRQEQSTTATGSVVGSLTGDVTLTANEAYNQTGSRVIAREGDIDIAAKRVDIIEAREDATSEHKVTHQQSGLSVTISNPVLALAQTVQQVAKAASKSDDARLQALAGGTAALAGKNTADAVQQDPSAAGGLNISITVGGSTQQTRETNQRSTASGSQIQAGGDVSIQAKGDGEASTLTVRGGDIKASGDVNLKADGAINLTAAENTSTHRRDSQGMGGGIGVGASIGGKGSPSIGITANAHFSQGKGEGDDLAWTNTQVTAGNTLALESGGDTTLKGAEARGKQVIANVGGNLKIESLQDTSTYESRDTSISGSMTAGLGFSGSVNFSHQQIDSDYASVIKQSGIKAGDEGFQVKVQGNTDLTGAVIASTDKAVEAGKNRLTTATLTQRDVENKAEYSAMSVGFGGGMSLGGSGGGGDGGGDGTSNDGNAPKVGTDQQGRATTGANMVPGREAPKMSGLSVTPPMIAAASDNARSTTKSGISGGVIEITDEAKQLALTGKTAETTIAQTNRDVSSDKDGSHALGKIFDKEKIEAGFEIVAAFQRELGQFVTNRAKEADNLQKARDAETDPGKRAALDAKLEDAQKWAPGGTYRRIATAIAAAAGGNVTAGAGEMVTRGAVNYLQSLGAEKVKAIADELKSETARTALQGIVGCAGAAASGGNCGAGALGASASVVLNNLLDKAGGKSSEDLSAEAKETRTNLVTSLVAGIAAATSGDIATAATSAKIETENNALTLGEFKSLIKEAKTCEQTGTCKEVRDKYRTLSQENQEKVVATCAADPQACQGEFGHYLTELDGFRKALNEAVGSKLPSEIKGDLALYLLHYNDTIAAANEPEFAKQVQEKFGISIELAQAAAAISASVSGAKSTWKHVLSKGAGKTREITPDASVAKNIKLVAEYGPLNQGPLPQSVANTFRSGKYSEVILGRPTTLYRVYGGSAGELGAYWSRTPPKGPVQSIVDSALNPKWGNTATKVVKIEVPAGTKLFEGIAAAQGGLVGGGSQVLFPKDTKIDSSWVKK